MKTLKIALLSLAAALGEKDVDNSDLVLDAKQKKRLLRRAVHAYDDLAGLEAVKNAEG